MSRCGFTLVEVAVATALLAIAGAAVQGLVTQSLATIDRDVRRAGTLVGARSLLAESLVAVPVPGTTSGSLAGGLRWRRTVTATRHPSLVEVRVHVEQPDGTGGIDLVELGYARAR